MPYGPLEVYQRFEGTYRLYLQGRKRDKLRNQRGDRYQAESFIFNGLRDVVSQKIESYIIKDLTTLNPTWLLQTVE
jgi:hypothetical protein